VATLKNLNYTIYFDSFNTLLVTTLFHVCYFIVGTGRQAGNRRQRAVRHRFNPRHMKSGIEYRGCEATEESRGAKDFRDGERADETGGKFTRLHPEGQVRSGKPYPSARANSVEQGNPPVANTWMWSLEERPGFSSRYGDSGRRTSGERVSQGTLEGRETSGQAGKGVTDIYQPHKLLAPGGEVGGDEATKSHLQVLIGSLQLAIRLGVITRG
jgi:hypothetical protein